MDLKDRFPYDKEAFKDKQPWDPGITENQKVAFLMSMIRPDEGATLMTAIQAVRMHGNGEYRITEVALAAATMLMYCYEFLDWKPEDALEQSLRVVMPALYDVMVKDAKAATEGEKNALSAAIEKELQSVLKH